MGMKVENYNMTDLEKYHKFRSQNVDLPTLDAIRLYNLHRQEDAKKFVENFMKLRDQFSRTFKAWNFGEHVSIYMHKHQFGLELQYSYDKAEQDAHIISLQITFFTLEIRF